MFSTRLHFLAFYALLIFSNVAVAAPTSICNYFLENANTANPFAIRNPSPELRRLVDETDKTACNEMHMRMLVRQEAMKARKKSVNGSDSFFSIRSERKRLNKIVEVLEYARRGTKPYDATNAFKVNTAQVSGRAAIFDLINNSRKGVQKPDRKTISATKLLGSILAVNAVGIAGVSAIIANATPSGPSTWSFLGIGACSAVTCIGNSWAYWKHRQNNSILRENELLEMLESILLGEISLKPNDYLHIRRDLSAGDHIDIFFEYDSRTEQPILDIIQWNYQKDPPVDP